MIMSIRAIGLVIGLVLIAGCGTSPKEHFYTLAAAEAPAAPAATKTEFTVAVGPVSVPEMVDRPQLVLRTGANRVEVSEGNRWAEPLKRSIPRVVAASLAQQLTSARVVVFPPSEGSTDYRVLIDVERFESEPGKAAIISASWSVRRSAGGATRSGRSVVREPAGAGLEALVAAHSKALDGVARDIAEAVRTMGR